MGDSYVSVEHLFFGLTEKPDPAVKKLLSRFKIRRTNLCRRWRGCGVISG